MERASVSIEKIYKGESEREISITHKIEICLGALPVNEPVFLFVATKPGKHNAGMVAYVRVRYAPAGFAQKLVRMPDDRSRLADP